jgi:predicted enzyme related to lactoylglutathione lyase
MASKKSARKKSAPTKATKKKAVKKKAAKKVAKKPARRVARAAARTAAPEQPTGPPRLTGPSVVHWEVQARDPSAQMRFFGELFGWNVDANNPQNYGMVTPAGPGSIGGGIGATMDDAPRATFYVQVPSIADTLDKAATMGGQTLMPRTDIGMIVMAQFRDPEGNVIGLVEG